MLTGLRGLRWQLLVSCLALVGAVSALASCSSDGDTTTVAAQGALSASEWREAVDARCRTAPVTVGVGGSDAETIEGLRVVVGELADLQPPPELAAPAGEWLAALDRSLDAESALLASGDSADPEAIADLIVSADAARESSSALAQQLGLQECGTPPPASRTFEPPEG